jgi:spore coat polysaccharide biosynthesis protein SpsF
MMPLAGQPMIGHVVQRAKSCALVNQVIVATSIEGSDDPIATYCHDARIECYRGSLSNVMSRYIEVLNSAASDYFVRITGDCPVIDPSFIDRQIRALRAHDGDHVWLANSISVLEGQGVHSTRSLRHVCEQSEHPDDLEHVGSRYFAEHPEEFRIVGMQPPQALLEAKWRLTVDEPADFEVMQALYEALWQGEPLQFTEALNWLAKNPQIANLNKVVEHSTINQELAQKRSSWSEHVELFCDWEDPYKVVSPN